MTTIATATGSGTQDALHFKSSDPLTLGVELELQVISRLDADLTRGATELLGLIDRRAHQGDFKPEITESMIEVSTAQIHRRIDTLTTELLGARTSLLSAADRLNLLVCGGGAHPFQHWADQKLFDKPRFHQLGEMYGYLAKQFTVFGQHIHIGCPNGDEALYLLHALSRFVPHFIVLSAASPYYQGVDTAFDSSRLNAISAFPLSGRAPMVKRWDDFVAYFEHMRSFGIVESMKDFYWDIRPKPEFGTVEIRICDTPLTVTRAIELTAFAQTLCRYLLVERPFVIDESLYAVYSFNRYQAARYGIEGFVVDPASRQRIALRDDLAATFDRLAPHARELGTAEQLARLAEVLAQGNGAQWMRGVYQQNRSFADLVWQQALRWREG